MNIQVLFLKIRLSVTSFMSLGSLFQQVAPLCCSRREFICFLSRLQLFSEESGVDGQNYVVLRVTVSDPPQICTFPPHPLSIERYQQRLPIHNIKLTIVEKINKPSLMMLVGL